MGGVVKKRLRITAPELSLV